MTNEEAKQLAVFFTKVNNSRKTRIVFHLNRLIYYFDKHLKAVITLSKLLAKDATTVQGTKQSIVVFIVGGCSDL